MVLRNPADVRWDHLGPPRFAKCIITDTEQVLSLDIAASQGTDYTISSSQKAHPLTDSVPKMLQFFQGFKDTGMSCSILKNIIMNYWYKKGKWGSSAAAAGFFRNWGSFLSTSKDCCLKSVLSVLWKWKTGPSENFEKENLFVSF